MVITINKKEEKLKCPVCGKILAQGTAFCPDCGAHVDVNENDKRKKIAKLVGKYAKEIDKGYRDSAFGGGTFYTYEVITDKQKKNLLKFHKDLDFNTFVCILDESILHSGKEGLLFTLSGFYAHWGPLSGSTFFRYSDIDDMQPLAEDVLRIYFKGNAELKYKEISTFYLAEPLKELLEQIIEIDKMADTSYLDATSSGSVSGIFSNKNREIFLEGQKSGYIRCSRQYEIKLRRQADLFLQTTNKWKQEKVEYEQLLDEYDKTVAELEEKIAETGSSEYEERLKRVRETQQELKNLSR